MQWAWLIPVFSFAAAPIIVLIGDRLPGKGAVLSIAAIGAGFVFFWIALFGWMGATDGTEHCMIAVGTEALTCNYERTWFNAGLQGLPGSVELTWGFFVDPLTIAMLGLVTFVALMVQIYSLGYMRGDPRINWYFAVHALFAASMLTIILADSFLLLYVAWELVGVCSYLLIGFWHERPAAREAAKKAFIVTRIGDVGLLIGILLLWHEVGTFGMTDAFEAVQAGTLSEGVTIAAALLLFLGAMGKSAPNPVPCVAARRDGGPDAGQRPDPRSDDGGCRGVPGGPRLPAVRGIQCRAADGGCHRGPGHGAGDLDHRAGVDGHQANLGLLHRQPPGADDAVAGRFRIYGRHFHLLAHGLPKRSFSSERAVLFTAPKSRKSPNWAACAG